jgi:hypothetical protein
MVNQTAKGTRWRYAVTTYLRQRGHVVIVTPNGAAGDDLDVRVLGATVARLSVEAKDWSKFSPATWLAQAKANAGSRVPVVFVKQRGKSSAGEGFVLMTGEAFADLLDRVRS